jgi:hypothetical protein
MVRKSEEKQTVRKPAPFNGVGEITVRSLLNGPEEMSQKGRVVIPLFIQAVRSAIMFTRETARLITFSAVTDVIMTMVRSQRSALVM